MTEGETELNKTGEIERERAGRREKGRESAILIKLISTWLMCKGKGFAVIDWSKIQNDQKGGAEFIM